MKRFLALFALISWVAGCGEAPEKAGTPAATSEPAAASGEIVEELAQPADTTRAPEPPKSVVANVTVTDLQGKPLAGMLSIATKSPNAFDNPVAQGSESGADGLSTLLLPPGERVFVRAWDPSMSTFANNYYEIPGLPGEKTQPMTIEMVPASGITAKILDEQGQPIAGQEVRLMLVHATKGPWWPAQTISDGEGKVVYRNIPSGRFTVELGSRELGVAEMREVPLPPGLVVDFDKVTVKKLVEQ